MNSLSHIAACCGCAFAILNLGGCASNGGYVSSEDGSIAADKCLPQRSFRNGYSVETIIIDPTCPLGYNGITAEHHSGMLFSDMVLHP